MNNLGYTKPLFILAFDHQSTFEKEGIQNISELKQIIYGGFKKSLNVVQNAAILIDEKYGEEILKDAKKNSYTIALKVEKSGQQDFVFEYEEEFASHIEKYNPNFAKVVIKVQDDLSELTVANLKKLSDYIHATPVKLIVELITQGNVSLILKTIGELQDAHVEPDVWKIEGMENDLDYLSIVEEAKKGGRDGVSIVILGRGEDKETVEKWIKGASKTNGITGFAIGRTIFWEPIMMFKDGKINREEAVNKISENYIHFYRLFTE